MERNGLGVRRRALFGAAVGAALLASGCTSGGGDDDDHDDQGDDHGGDSGGTAPDGVLGGNFNGDPTGCGFAELEGAKASWLRGFITIHPEKALGKTEQAANSTLLSASKRGYGTVLNLKLPFSDSPFPDPDSSEMDKLLARIDAELDTVMDKVNILAVGNEPFVESRQQDWDGPLGDFYEKVAEHVLAYRAKHFPEHCRTRIYMGALNNLQKKEWRGDGAERWMKFVRSTQGIEGVDIHPHVSSPKEASAFLDFVLPRLGSGQKFLVTEFSLVWLWKKHLTDRIPDKFAKRYGMSADTEVWQAIKDAIDHPWSQTKWDDLLKMSPWYTERHHYLKNQVNQFRESGRLAVAAYPVVQGKPSVTDFGPKKNPWLLNSLYAGRTVQRDENSPTPAPGLDWLDDFKAVQREQDKLPVNTGTVST